MRAPFVAVLGAVLLFGVSSCGSNLPPGAVRGPESGEVRLDLPSSGGQIVTVPPSPSGATARAYVVDFWSPSCVPCKTTVPALASTRRELRANGVELHLVAVLQPGETTEDAEKALREWGVDGTFLVDKVGASRAAAGVDTIPQTLVLDRVGNVRWAKPMSGPTSDVVTAATTVASEE